MCPLSCAAQGSRVCSLPEAATETDLLLLLLTVVAPRSDESWDKKQKKERLKREKEQVGPYRMRL